MCILREVSRKRREAEYALSELPILCAWESLSRVLVSVDVWSSLVGSEGTRACSCCPWDGLEGART